MVDWPKLLSWIPQRLATSSERIRVAEICNPDGPDTEWQLYTGLVPLRCLHALIERPHSQNLGHEVQTSGPFPDQAGYKPWFTIPGGAIAPKGFEPLVVAWESANRLVLVPDQGFLMTFGLIPRLVHGASIEMRWDDVSVPSLDVVTAAPVSSYSYPDHSHAFVDVAKHYLEEYATLRQLALVCFFYAKAIGPVTDDIADLVPEDGAHVRSTPGRTIDLRMILGRPLACAQTWGVHLLLKPGCRPVRRARWDYGTLDWPDIGSVTDQRALAVCSKTAYVDDRVLGTYEGKSAYSICPATGSVRYGNQWSVTTVSRVGRNVLQVDLKKLYEGCPAEVVRLWHRYAVPRPTNVSVSNIATRSKRIVDGILQVGEQLAAIAKTMGKDLAPSEFVGLVRADLDCNGWWTDPRIEPIARHSPEGMTHGSFVSRCADLYRLVVESLSERRLRDLLAAIGIVDASLQEARSLKLLERLIVLAHTADTTGLRLTADSSILESRRNEFAASAPARILFDLNTLRQAASHTQGESLKKKESEAIRTFGIDVAACAAGWGAALDAVYDRVATALEEIAATLKRGRTTG